MQGVMLNNTKQCLAFLSISMFLAEQYSVMLSNQKAQKTQKGGNNGGSGNMDNKKIAMFSNLKCNAEQC